MLFELAGIQALRLLLRSSAERAEQIMGTAIWNEAQMILAEANQLVPFELGNLASTGQVSDPKTVSEGVVDVEVGFGNNIAPYGYDENGRPQHNYAVIQHERLDFRHAPGRQAKYLEQPALEAAATMGPRLAGVVGRALWDQTAGRDVRDLFGGGRNRPSGPDSEGAA